MERIKIVVILLQLIDSLTKHESWCGETHVQKATYSLQKLQNVPLNFNFILYKHGPFSFDLRDELTAMRADGLIAFKIVNESYGPRLIITERGKEIQKQFVKTINQYENNIEFIGTKLGHKGVVELERIATALYVTKDLNIKNDEKRVSMITDLKPHIKPEQATKAFKEIDALIKSSNN